MAKKKKPLSHAEIWDDSYLLQSWEEALEEYKLYHSIHARGERVEDVIGLLEAQNEDSDPFMDMQNGAANVAETKSDVREELEDGEVKEGASDAMPMADGHAGEQEDVTLLEYVPETSQLPQADSSGQPKIPNAMPNVVIDGVKDESLKNLMMSWYYAGYYTGLYEGQQQASNRTVN